MATIGHLEVFVIVVVVGLSFQGALAIKCWKCSSDAANLQEFCGNPFDSNILSDKSDYYVQCPEPYGRFNPRSPSSNQRAACLKSTQTVRGKFVIVRKCHIEDVDSSRNSCINNPVTDGKVEFCETCSTDGCNGATQFSPVSLLMVFPVVIAKMLLL